MLVFDRDTRAAGAFLLLSLITWLGVVGLDDGQSCCGID